MNETATFFDMMRTGAAIAGTAGGLFVLYHTAKAVYDDVWGRVVQARQDGITLDDMRQQTQLAAVRTIQADAAGRYPLLYGTSGLIRDPNSLRLFTLDTVRETWPAIERLDAVARVVLAGGGWPAAPAQAQLLDAGTAGPAVTLGPSTLTGLLSKYAFTPRLHKVLIGEYIGDDGMPKPLTLDVPKSVHVLCTGASGLGKSTLLETIALQLAGLDGVQLAAIDYGSGTFDGLEDALHWRLADSPGLALALFHELIKLYQERRERYKEVGRVRSLDQYNAATGDGLPFVACFVDETSALLEHDGTKGPLIELARVGRKYGLGLLLGGTDFKASTLPSEARSNCLARLAFWLEPGLSRSLLNCDAASDESMTVGDVVAKRPGTVGTLRGHTPEVTEAAYARLAQRAGDGLELREVKTPSKSNGHGHKPNLDAIDDPALPDDDRARRLVAAGVSKRQTAIRVFGGAAGGAWRKLERALAGSSSTAEGAAAQPGHTTGHKGTTTTTARAVDWCDHCGDFAADVDQGVTFATCSKCGVAVCSECAAGGLCPDCQEGDTQDD